MTTITLVKPPVNYCSYSNPNSQGTLIRATGLFQFATEGHPCGSSIWFNYQHDFYDEPMRKQQEQRLQVVPVDCEITSAWVDHMEMCDRNKYRKMLKIMHNGNEGKYGGGLNGLIQRCPEKCLIDAASFYFDRNVTCLRWVYYYNTATGYCCQRLDAIYKKQ